MAVDFNENLESGQPGPSLGVTGIALTHGWSIVGYLECHTRNGTFSDPDSALRLRSGADRLARSVAEIRVPTSTSPKTRGHVLLVEDDAEQRKFDPAHGAMRTSTQPAASSWPAT